MKERQHLGRGKDTNLFKNLTGVGVREQRNHGTIINNLTHKPEALYETNEERDRLIEPGISHQGPVLKIQERYPIQKRGEDTPAYFTHGGYEDNSLHNKNDGFSPSHTHPNLEPQSPTNIPIKSPRLAGIPTESHRLAGIRRREAKAWEEILDQTIRVKELPKFMTPEIQGQLESMGFELRYIPALNLQIGEYKPEDNYPYLNNPYLKQNFDRRCPSYLKNGQRLDNWYWELIAQGNLDMPKLPGQWVAVETMPKPTHKETYLPSPVTDKLGFKNRFNVSWDKATEAIANNERHILASLGLTDKANITMLTALQWNLIGTREKWGKTNTFEWVKDRYKGANGDDNFRFMIGNSDHGGAGSISIQEPDQHFDWLGFRVAVVFNP